MRPGRKSRLITPLAVVALTFTLVAPAGAQNVEFCDVNAFTPFLRREGVLFTNLVVVGEAHAECPASNPSGPIAMGVCVDGVYAGFEIFGGDSTCGSYADTDGTVDGWAKVKCFAMVTYSTFAAAGGEDGQTDDVAIVFVDNSPSVFYDLNDCPPLPPVESDGGP